jgi:hypothetical protein
MLAQVYRHDVASSVDVAAARLERLPGNRRLVFDVNDFDETLPGPVEWDVKRLAASVVVAGRNNKLGAKSNRRIARATVAAYRKVLTAAAAADPLEVYYYRLDFDEVTARLATTKQDRRRVKKAHTKAAKRTSLGALKKLTDIVDGRRMIVSKPPLIVALHDDERHVELARITVGRQAVRRGGGDDPGRAGGLRHHLRSSPRPGPTPDPATPR